MSESILTAYLHSSRGDVAFLARRIFFILWFFFSNFSGKQFWLCNLTKCVGQSKIFSCCSNFM